MWLVSIAVIPNRGAGLEMVPGVPPTFGFANGLSLKGCREPKKVEKIWSIVLDIAALKGGGVNKFM